MTLPIRPRGVLPIHPAGTLPRHPPGSLPRHRSGSASSPRWAVLATSVLTAGCAGDLRDGATDPASPQAAAIDGLWNLSLWMGIAVWVAVMVLLAVPLLRSRRRTTAPGEGGRRARRELDAPPASELDEPLTTADPAHQGASDRDAPARSRLVWIGGLIGPVLILSVLLVASGRVGASTAQVEDDGELVIDVVGHMFWWEVHYPEQDITTANEIHVPVDRPVRLRLTTEDVIHSFWIPRLHGKIDMIPGTENELRFVAEEAGRFRGQCAEFCGIAHAQMVAFVEVQATEDFDAWARQQREDAVEPEVADAVEGREAFLGAGCAACHTVRGTAAVGSVGPDLTHLASRETLAAGVVPNTREHLAELIVDPWAIKPGIAMPPTVLDDDELEVLLDYLETLE